MISVIVPVYNTEKYLERCVNSILSQSYSDFEIFLVDDGSKDGSLNKCYELAALDKRIKVLAKENGGCGSARNFALPHVCGDYITFIDSDDIVSNVFLEHMLKVARSGNYDIVQANQKNFKSEQEAQLCDDNSSVVIGVAVSKADALNKRVFMPSACAKLYNARLFNNFRFDEERINEDESSYYILADKATSLACLDEYLYFYRMTDNSIMRNTNHKKSTVFIDIYRERIEYFKNKGDSDLLNGSYARFGIVLIRFYASRKKDPQNENDLGEILRIFKENYKNIRFDKTLQKKDKLVLRLFRRLPRLTAYAVGKTR